MRVSSTIARRYTRQVFSPWRLVIKAIDSKCQGSLNDSAVCGYCHVEHDSGLADCKRGHSLLSNRNQITDARNKMNELACKILKVQHNRHAHKSKHGDHVQVDHECLIQYLINNFGLKEKAVSEGVELVFTADGAQSCGAKSASQTAAGIKIMDKSALDPITKKPMFVAEYDPNNNPSILKNCQNFCFIPRWNWNATAMKNNIEMQRK